jgi:Leucine-rich repeat (LRR) protein
LERVTELSLRGENAGPDHCEQTDLGFDPDLIEGKTFFEFCNEAGPLSRQVTLHALKTILGADSCAQLEERLSESTNLNLDAAELMDLSPLSFFPQLERLSLRDNRLRTVAPLASLPNLRFVDISYNDVRDASLLGGGGLGSRLWLVGEKRQEWNLPRTNFIRICSRPAEASPEAMRTVRAIVEQLGLRPRQCVNANYELIRLKSWEFWRVRGLVDMSPLADLASLEELSLRNQNVADIGFLSTLPELRKLMLDGNPVTDFSPIANLPILNSLSVQNMQIRDISFVNALRRLRDLSVHNNYIQDFSSLVPQENRGLEVSGKNLQTIPAN